MFETAETVERYRLFFFFILVPWIFPWEIDEKVFKKSFRVKEKSYKNPRTRVLSRLIFPPSFVEIRLVVFRVIQQTRVKERRLKNTGTLTWPPWHRSNQDLDNRSYFINLKVTVIDQDLAPWKPNRNQQIQHVTDPTGACVSPPMSDETHICKGVCVCVCYDCSNRGAGPREGERDGEGVGGRGRGLFISVVGSFF